MLSITSEIRCVHSYSLSLWNADGKAITTYTLLKLRNEAQKRIFFVPFTFTFLCSLDIY